MKLADFRRNAADTGAAELRRMLARFNDNHTAYPRDSTVHALFTARAAARPDAVAVMHGEREYSYREIEAASTRFARFLIGQGLRPEDPVGIMLESAFELVVALLGILKAGGAYVPLAFGDPFERIRYVLDDTGARILICERRFMRLVNRLQWECPRLDILFCADSRDIHAEHEDVGELMRMPLWDHVGETAFDDISGGGWTSSYTGEWLGRDVMDEYAYNIRAKLLPYLSSTTRLLEIGCGSGISLLRLAPLVGACCATDLSRAILGRTEQAAALAGLRNIRLRHLPAHDTHLLDEAGFDVVVMNSVVQCFSGHNYLRDVLRQAIAKMADRGVLFLGNLLDLDRKADFVSSLTAFRDSHVGDGHRTKIDRSEELFVARDFLEDLRHDFPEIRSVECSAMLGRTQSELSEYGYDALLQIDKTSRPAVPPRPRSKHQLDLRSLDDSTALPLAEMSGPEGLAYVIYTSGTSGRPKGVMVEHRGIVRLVRDTNYIDLGPDDRILQTGSLAFDASTFEIWGALLNGGALSCPPKQAILDPVELRRLLVRHRITTMFLTTSLFNQHVDSNIALFTGLRRVLTGGERASVPHFNKLREQFQALELIHCYGPTENTAFTTCHVVARSYEGDVPIGRPIANTEVLILDPAGNPVPVGTAGEICAAGDGLARGYLNDPVLTAQKFVVHPFDPQQRMYRTGDLGLWRADGTIEFLGRIDDQIKIRGHRVEPGEVEATILADPLVREALVMGRTIAGSGLELVAYVTLRRERAEAAIEGLRDRLKQSLPEHMLPSAIIQLSKMPLNASGKVDRKALPEPVADVTAPGDRHVPPATETERSLAAIWEEVLGHGSIGATDNFFSAGGHSLKVTKAVALIESRLAATVPLTVFFRRPTIRELAAYILDNATFGVAAADEALVPLNASRRGPALFAFPPGTGDAIGYLQLAGLLPCRVYGFNFVESATRLKEYADLIVGTEPDGPYVLFGYSSGGNLAYGVARELEERGCRVAGIVMVDSARRLRPMPIPDDEIEHVIGEFLDADSIRPHVARPLLREKAARRIRSSLAYAANTTDHHVIDADIHVLTGADATDEFRDASGALVISVAGWADVTRGRLRVYRGVGGHNHMLAHPHLDANAATIRGIVEDIAAGAGLPAVGVSA